MLTAKAPEPGALPPTLLRFSAPNVLNLLAIACMITFDGLFLGRLGPDALAGVSLALTFVMLIQHTAASGMGGRRLIRDCARARRRQARRRRRAYAPHVCSGSWPRGGLVDRAAARRAIRLSMDGRPWRDTVVRACLPNVAFSGAVSIYMHDLPRPVLSSHPKRCSLKFVQEEAGSLPPRLDAGPGRKQWPPTSL